MPTEPAPAAPSEPGRRIECARAEYPALWRTVVQAWQNAGDANAAWLTYSANYLLVTAGVHWALDPFSLLTRVGGGQQPDFREDLSCLRLVVLSHAHNDHLDLNLIAALRDRPLTWVIPDFLLEKVRQTVQLPPERIRIPRAGVPIRVDGLTLVPFLAQHFRGTSGVPEMGYAAEFNGQRWLFPGDTRTYTAERLPRYNRLDGAFAHLWLGKGCAQQTDPPLVEDFCRFFTAFQPRRIVVTHLEELGRADDDRWTLEHYRLVRSRLLDIAPQTQVCPACPGQRISLE